MSLLLGFVWTTALFFFFARFGFLLPAGFVMAFSPSFSRENFFLRRVVNFIVNLFLQKEKSFFDFWAIFFKKFFKMPTGHKIMSSQKAHTGFSKPPNRQRKRTAPPAVPRAMKSRISPSPAMTKRNTEEAAVRQNAASSTPPQRRPPQDRRLADHRPAAPRHSSP